MGHPCVSLCHGIQTFIAGTRFPPGTTPPEFRDARVCLESSETSHASAAVTQAGCYKSERVSIDSDGRRSAQERATRRRNVEVDPAELRTRNQRHQAALAAAV
jgi:hypothetical protein